MINLIDDALRNLLSNHTYANEKVRVDLDPPTKDWAARRTGPVLNLFLNDVREDTTKRASNLVEVRNETGVVVGRRYVDRTFMFTYALSAWTSRPEDDHELLGAAMSALLRQDFLTADLCTGELAELAARGRPANLRVGGLLYSDRLVTDLWTAIGGEYRPILAVTVATIMPAGATIAAGPPQTVPPKFFFTDTVSQTTELIRGPDPLERQPEPGEVRRIRKRQPLEREEVKQTVPETPEPTTRTRPRNKT
jgi:hypothetical protein